MYCQKCWSNELDSAEECSKCGTKFADKKAGQTSVSLGPSFWFDVAKLMGLDMLIGCIPTLLGCIPWIVGLLFVLGFLSRYYYFK